MRHAGLVVGYASIAVGLAGVAYHLNSQFFSQWTIRSLVYTAPFAAPVAYAGQARRHARTVVASRVKTRGSPRRRLACRRDNTASIGGEIGSRRPTRVFDRAGDSRTTPPGSSTSSHRRPRISRFRHPE